MHCRRSRSPRLKSTYKNIHLLIILVTLCLHINWILWFGFPWDNEVGKNPPMKILLLLEMWILTFDIRVVSKYRCHVHKSFSSKKKKQQQNASALWNKWVCQLELRQYFARCDDVGDLSASVTLRTELRRSHKLPNDWSILGWTVFKFRKDDKTLYRERLLSD